MKKLFFRIFRKKIDEYRDFSIQKKISVAFVLLLVPLILFVLIWFVCALDATNRYDKVVRNTSIISEFNLDFKKNYDYKIYLITTGNRTYEDQNPEQDIRYAKDIIRRVKVTTENSENKECIAQIERYFQVLEKYTKTTLHFYTSIINTSDEKSKPFGKMEVEDSTAFCYDKRKQFGSCAEQGGLKRSTDPGLSPEIERGRILCTMK